MATGYFTHAACRLHDMGPGHPECPQRLGAIDDHLLAQGLDGLLIRRDAPQAMVDQLARAHDHGYVTSTLALLEGLQHTGQHRLLDPDTVAMADTGEAALRAAGAALAATDAVLDGELRNAFCAVRPPGHHATRDRAMGFCLFNNVAVAARHALEASGLNRVAVVDFDVHHGNGTEDILAGDERVLMVGLFQHPFYPHSGAQPSAANMINVPLRARSDGQAARDAVMQHWMPALEAFKPEMIFISAGFDAHREDDLGGLALVEADYAWITEQVLAVADRYAQGRVVSCLEGGYNLSALGRSVVAHLKALTSA